MSEKILKFFHHPPQNDADKSNKNDKNDKNDIDEIFNHHQSGGVGIAVQLFRQMFFIPLKIAKMIKTTVTGQ
jgi:hypothetical protein